MLGPWAPNMYHIQILHITDGPSPTVLHEVSVPIISNEECYEWFNEAGYSKPVPKTMMCAGFKEGGKDSCQVQWNLDIVNWVL